MAERDGGGLFGDQRAAVMGRGDAASIAKVHIPLEFRRRRGRKVLVAPDGAGQELPGFPGAPVHARGEVTPALRALARAFRWRGLLESGAVATVHEIAVAENINPSYVSRVLTLTLLAPETVEEAMKVGGAGMLDGVKIPFPVEWSRGPSFGA